MATGMLHAGRGRHHEALEEFSAAEHLRSQLAGSHALASQVTGWLLATQARLGMTGEARAALAALDDERAGSGEIRNARAVICLAEGDPAGALGALRRRPGRHGTGHRVRHGRGGSPAGRARPPRSSVTSARRTRRPNARSPSPSLTGWSCRSR